MWLKSTFTLTTVVAIRFCLIGGTVPAVADILHVPDDYPTVKNGSDAAFTGDEVVAADGVNTGDGNRTLDFDSNWKEKT